VASADPFGENPYYNCQLFSVSALGGGLRQLTHFGEGVPSQEGCQIGEKPGCGVKAIDLDGPSPTTVFYSDCDPFGTNRDGSEIFALGVAGRRLRQLTETAGVTIATADAVEVEVPGPAAQSGP
jgi:hypothetical protein